MTNSMRKKNLLNCRGSFTISQHLIQKEPENVMKLLSQFLIIRCESLFDIQAFKYTAFSFLFDEIDNHFKSPNYEINIKDLEDEETGEITYVIDSVTKTGEITYVIDSVTRLPIT